MQRTLTSHTGAEFESGAVHRARGVNEAMPGVEVDATGLDDDGDGWTGGHANVRHVNGTLNTPQLPGVLGVLPETANFPPLLEIVINSDPHNTVINC